MNRRNTYGKKIGSIFQCQWNNKENSRDDCSGGKSGFGNTVSELKLSAPDADIVEGKVFQRAAKQEIEEWVKRII